MIANIKVAEAMTTKPVITSADTLISDCAALMKKFDVGSVLVQNGDEIQGIVTEYDLTRKVVAESMDYHEPVSEIMAKALVTIEPDRDLVEALQAMKNNDIRHLPVIEDGELIGFITLKDILKIAPALFDLVVDNFRLREESRKPIGELEREDLE